MRRTGAIIFGRRTALASVAVIAGALGAVRAETLTARAGVSGNSVFVGEPFRFQIQVSGSETPEQPDLSGLGGFKVSFSGGGANSRRSVRIINGQRSENVQLGYLLNYELRATREGRLTIPAIAVKAEGKTATTQPLVIVAQKPSETENFKLRLSVSKERAYVGEQILLEAVFYFARGNEIDRSGGIQLSLPVEDNPAFDLHDLDGGQDRGPEQLEGKNFQTSRVRKVLVPTRAGSFPLEPATLSFRSGDGFEIVRDFFGNRVRRPKFKNIAIPSNPLNLVVAPLPREGQPAGFAGHVGEYSVSVQASPSEVNVGDPITLNIALSGPPLLDPVELPPLHEQKSLTADFKVPAEIEDGTVNGNFKVFTQTIRALRDDVKAIPPLELAYFDSAKGRYEVARSQAIPLVVRATRVVTSGDAEGLRPVEAAKLEVQSWMQGIAHNYSGSEALSKQVLGFSGLASAGRLTIVAGPPLAYAILLAVVAGVRRRNAHPETMRARRAMGGFHRGVSHATTSEDVLAVFCRYLGDKLAMTSDALTFRDVEAPLRERGVDDGKLEEIRNLFTAGEASRFAGGIGGEDVAAERDRAAKLVKELEKSLR